MTPTRRRFLSGTALAAGTAAAASTVAGAALAALPEPVVQTGPRTVPPSPPPTGRPFTPMVTLNGWSLPWRMNGGVKEFHLVAEPVVRELAPGMQAHLWGYNGASPGPTIEVVEGDRVRIFVTNRLPEHTTVHWHGQRLPNGMDGVGGLNQPHIPAGKTYVYEFVLRRSGTFMYHPHADEMVQMAMGMYGLFVVHPKDPAFQPVDRDYGLILAAFDIEPGARTPRTSEMLAFNLWTFNSRVFPGIDPMVARLGERVRIRVGNLTMTNHPIHLHGHEFAVTGTDGGWTRESARWNEVTVDVAVGQMRAIEFVADEPGDWAFHCHKSHHTMNAMGHDLPNLIGVDHTGIVERVTKLIPDYMAMGERGMADMAEMRMPLPDNTLPMMAGQGPFGPVEMGGMFTVLKVRAEQARGDFRDPGWYRHPPGEVAYEFTGTLPEPARSFAAGAGAMPSARRPKAPAEMRARKPSHRNPGHDGH